MFRHIALSLLTIALTAPLLAAEGMPYTKNVAIVIYEGVEVLDFTGPAEVFQSASGYGADGRARAFHLYTVSRTKKPITSMGFINVTPDYSIEDSPKPDILILPGGNSQVVIDDAAWMRWVEQSGAGAENVLTVCTGAFIAGKAGLLKGIDATTWYNAVPALEKNFPDTHVIPGRRFIDNGKMITTAGVSAGIDGSLHLVARLLGRYVADRTAEYMEYKWSPESYLSAHYATLNPRLDERGRTLQQAAIAVREGNASAAVSSYRSLIAANEGDAEAWLQLARTYHGMKRYTEAMDANRQAAKGEAQRGLALYNLACELALAGAPDQAIETAAQAIDAGYRLRYSYEQDEDLISVRNDPRFQALMAKL
jgi:transcriptional regulator GlxA family with amidase domain